MAVRFVCAQCGAYMAVTIRGLKCLYCGREIVIEDGRRKEQHNAAVPDPASVR